jgi:intracellular sulfur oxidation DsrE/DsrF family protein
MIDGFTSATPRRGFIGSIAAAAMGLSLATPEGAAATAPTVSRAANPQLEAWFGKLTGKHRVVFDAPEPNGGMAAIWPRIYLNTMAATYPGEAASAMVILRHQGLALALSDAIWAKYPISDMFNIKPNGAAVTANPYATITGLPIPGLGVAELLKGGVLFGACDVALTVYSSGAAGKMNLDPAAVKKEWVAGLLPGIMVVPSGVMGVARAQEFEARYIFAG